MRTVDLAEVELGTWRAMESTVAQLKVAMDGMEKQAAILQAALASVNATGFPAPGRGRRIVNSIKKFFAI